METRDIGALDRLIGEIDKAIKVLAAPASPARPAPHTPGGENLDPFERLESTRLMRVNHSGEVAAQALYQGQALTARSKTVSTAMQHAAAEETDHLAWCESRLRQLGGRTSLLNPLWYFGSFAIGAVAGLSGDRTSLSFVAETERQVEAHLRQHLARLPASDHSSRAILAQMTHDEMQHGERALSLGGADLPRPVARAMGWVAKLMTRGSYWF